MQHRCLLAMMVMLAVSGCDRYQEGMNLLHQGKYQEAQDYFEKQATKRPNDPRVHLELGFAYSQLEHGFDAAREYQTALQLKPDYFEAELNLGTAFMKMGQEEPAEAHLKRALVLNPKSETAHANLAVLYFNEMRFSEAKPEALAAKDLSGGRRDYKGLLDKIDNQVKYYEDFWEREKKIQAELEAKRRAFKAETQKGATAQ